jgi:hypothetical protein
MQYEKKTAPTQAMSWCQNQAGIKERIYKMVVSPEERTRFLSQAHEPRGGNNLTVHLSQNCATTKNPSPCGEGLSVYTN